MHRNPNFAHVGILGFLVLKILKVPNYEMFKDKLIPNIAKVSRKFVYATHKCNQNET